MRGNHRLKLQLSHGLMQQSRRWYVSVSVSVVCDPGEKTGVAAASAAVLWVS